MEVDLAGLFAPGAWGSSPCVVRGALPPEELGPFEPAALEARHGDTPVLVRTYHPGYHRGRIPRGGGERRPLRELLRGGAGAGAGGDRRQAVLHFGVQPTPLDDILEPVAARLRGWLAPLGDRYTTAEGVCRLSRLPWAFGAHYDCREQLLVQLAGERTFDFMPYKDGDYPRLYGQTRLTGDSVTLRPGDLLHLPALLSHAVRAPGDRGLSVLCGLFADPAPGTAGAAAALCERLFQRDFARRAEDLGRRDHRRL